MINYLSKAVSAERAYPGLAFQGTFAMARKSGWQGREAAGHVTVAITESRAMNHFSAKFPFFTCIVQDPGREMVPPTVTVQLPSSLSTIKTSPLRRVYAEAHPSPRPRICGAED